MRRPASRRAFTLIETIAAVVVLAIAVPIMFRTVQEAHAQRVNPSRMSKARWLATEKLEDVIADRHSATRGWDYLVAGNYTDEDPVAGFDGYARSVTLTETWADLQSAGSGYMTVEVQVSWLDATETPRTLSVSTVVTEYIP